MASKKKNWRIKTKIIKVTEKKEESGKLKKEFEEAKGEEPKTETNEEIEEAREKAQANKRKFEEMKVNGWEYIEDLLM